MTPLWRLTHWKKERVFFLKFNKPIFWINFNPIIFNHYLLNCPTIVDVPIIVPNMFRTSSRISLPFIKFPIVFQIKGGTIQELDLHQALLSSITCAMPTSQNRGSKSPFVNPLRVANLTVSRIASRSDNQPVRKMVGRIASWSIANPSHSQSLSVGLPSVG